MIKSQNVRKDYCDDVYIKIRTIIHSLSVAVCSSIISKHTIFKEKQLKTLGHRQQSHVTARSVVTLSECLQGENNTALLASCK